MCILCVLAGSNLDSVNTVDLPDTAPTFALPTQFQQREDIFTELVDWDCVGYITKTLQQKMPETIVPLRTTGDGNCLLHALSRAVWGTEIYCDVLRAKMFEELQQHYEWYKKSSKYEEKEFETSIAFAGQPGAHLSFLHVLALSNLIKRPITIYAGDEDIDRFGTGEGGVAATVLPTRIPAAEVKGGNIALSWSSAVKNHYVPVIPLEGHPFEFPILEIAFKDSLPEGSQPTDYIKKSEITVRSEFAELLEKQRGEFSSGYSAESLKRAMLTMSGESSEVAAPSTNEEILKQYMMALQMRLEQRRRQQVEEQWRLLQRALGGRMSGKAGRRAPSRAFYVPEANIIVTDDADEDDSDEDEMDFDEDYDDLRPSAGYKTSSSSSERRNMIQRLTQGMSQEDKELVDESEELQDALVEREKLMQQVTQLKSYIKLQKWQQQMQEMIVRQQGGVLPQPTAEDLQRRERVQQFSQLVTVLEKALEQSSGMPQKRAAEKEAAAPPPLPKPEPVVVPVADPIAKQPDIVLTLNLKNNMNVQKQVKINYNLGEDPESVARRVIYAENISEAKYLTPIVNFIKKEVEKRAQKSSSSLEPPQAAIASTPSSSSVSPLPSPRCKHFPYKGDPIRFHRTGNTIQLAMDKMLAFNAELKAAASPAALSEAELSRLSDISPLLHADQLQASNFTPQHVALFIRVILAWPLEMLFPAIDLFRILILHNSAIEKLQAHDTAFDRLLTLCSDAAAPRPVRLTTLRLFANYTAEPRFTKVLNSLGHKLVSTIAASAADENKSVVSALLSVIINASTTMSRSATFDVGVKAELLDASVSVLKRIPRSEATEELKMLLVSMGTLLVSKMDLLSKFKSRGELLKLLQTELPPDIREIADELFELCKM